MGVNGIQWVKSALPAPGCQALELFSIESNVLRGGSLLCAGAERRFARICVTGISGAEWGHCVPPFDACPEGFLLRNLSGIVNMPSPLGGWINSLLGFDDLFKEENCKSTCYNVTRGKAKP